MGSKLVLWVFVLLCSVSAFASDPCGELLSPVKSENKDVEIVHEVRTLEEFLSTDPSKNLAYLHPLTLLNAFQRMAAWIRVQPTSEIMDPGFSGKKVQFYKIFSEASELNGGKSIVGQYEAIQEFVNYVYASARGDGAAVKMPLFTGPAGTGKTVFLDIMIEVAHHLSRTNPDYFLYTYEWHNLRSIDELYPVLNLQKTEAGDVFEHPIPNPLNESPLVILPEEYQQAVLGMARERAEAVSGVSPDPILTPNPQCKKIRDAVFAHYAKEDPNLFKDPVKMVQVLSKHIRIKRFVPGTGGMVTKIDNQARDVDYSGLFFSENPFIRAQFGAKDPMAYFFTGKILQSNGTFLLLDEFFRNDEMLRNLFLGIIESRIVQRGGSVTVPLDTVIIAASNDESIDDALSKGTAKAQLDRVRMIPMRLATHPFEIAKTMLLMKGIRNIEQRQLGQDQYTPAQLQEIFLLATNPSQKMLGLSGRYALRVKMGVNESPVDIAPHALELIALTTAMTRLQTDPAAAKEIGNYKVITESVFTDPATRLKALLGEYPIPQAEAEELRELSMYLKEGTFGISQRDAANVWLTKAINEAKLPENQNTLTPDLVKKVFKRLLEQGELKPRDNQTRLKWLTLIELAEKEFITRYIEQDVMAAFAQTMTALPEVYDEIYAEMLALAKDASAKEFTSPTGEVKPIDQQRVQAVIKNFENLTKRNFVPGELIDFDRTYGAGNNGSDKIRHKELLNAIQAFYVQASMVLASMNQYSAGGNDSLANSQVIEILRRDFGYSDRAARVALRWVQMAHSGSSQVQQ